MLTPFDDHPIHQTPSPIAQLASSDLNQYDRYFFNGHDADGELFFAAAMGHYPNRGVVDAAFCVVHDGVQHSVFASGLIGPDRSTRVGPLRVEILEGLRTLKVVVEPNDTGIVADLTFNARTPAVQEPRQTITRGNRMTMDYTRLTQWGNWSGTIGYDDVEIMVDPSAMRGTRDRSWGIRPVGTQAATNFPAVPPQVFWLWAPLHFDDVCTHMATFEHADGERWFESALTVPVLPSHDSPTWGMDSPAAETDSFRYQIDWEPGTREMRRASLTFESGSATEQIKLEKLLTFRMRGVGYFHPHWTHGSNHGLLEVGGERLVLDDVLPTDPASIHVQTLVRATWGNRIGIGVLELLAFGEHQPTGLTGLFDGFTG